MSKGFASNARMTLLGLGVLSCFVCVAVRLVFLHVVDRDDLLKLIEKARHQVVIEHARRGVILDTHGGLLAASRPYIELGFDPQVMRPEDEANWPKLASLLRLPEAQLAETLRRRPPAVVDGDGRTRPVQYVKICEGLDDKTYDQVQSLHIRGVYGTRNYRRVYPSGSLAAHVLGYINKEEVPVTGVERHFDLYLRGQDGWIESEKDGARRELAQFRSREVPAQDGYDVVLTIDSVIQHMIEEELRHLAAQYSPNFATIIVSDPATGAILGLASHPTFDLNEFNKVSFEVQRNRAVTDVIEPGSTFKIVPASAALNEQLVTPVSSFDCGSPTVVYHGRTLRLSKDDHPFQTLTVADIVAHSSNRGAAHLGLLLGENRLYDYVRRFGFGQPTGFPLGGEVRGLLEPPSRWDGLTITRLPMGHAVAATPLQIHYAMSVIANGGVLLRPQLVKEIRDPTGAVVRRMVPEIRHRVLATSTAATMAQLLAKVASAEGTAPEAAIPNFEVAGKTGTTQKIIDGKYSSTRHVASFIGFFPASRPEVVLSVIVDDAKMPHGGIAYGKAVAAPAFKRIGEQLVQYLDIKPVSGVRRNYFAVEGGAR
ncbi:MAG: penicillin-binding protein 2 [Opitutaceae bacterium]|nr:penicillin-binding protein 2 [Opitutaceae bacterium]